MIMALKDLINADDVKGFKKFLEENKLDRIFNEGLMGSPGDYVLLRNLLLNGKKEMAKFCIEKGFRVNPTSHCGNDYTPLHAAVLLRSKGMVELLLSKGASIEVHDRNGQTPLTLSAIIGCDEITDMLLSEVQPSNYTSNKEKFSHMHAACMRNCIQLVKRFLQQGADINSSVNLTSPDWPGYTPLHFAVHFNCIETIQLLIECGADIIKVDKNELTPLHLAFKYYNEELIDIILSAHYNFDSNPVSPEGLSHFHIACTRQNLELVQKFVTKGENIHNMISEEALNWAEFDALLFAIEFEQFEIIQFLLKQKVLFVAHNNIYSLGDLIYKKGNQDILDLFVSSLNDKKTNSEIEKFSSLSTQPVPNVDVEYEKCPVSDLLTVPPDQLFQRDSRGKTRIHHAFAKNRSKVLDELLVQHLQHSINPKDHNNLSHFHISCTRNDQTVVEHFLKNKVDINEVVDFDAPLFPGFTSLHFAIKYHQMDVALLLLNHGADYTLQNACGLSSFELLLAEVNSKSLSYTNKLNLFIVLEKILKINKGREPNLVTESKISLLHVACAKNDAVAIEKLVGDQTMNNIVCPTFPYWSGYTPLHCAAHYGNDDAIRLLLDMGANVSILNTKGKYPLHLRMERGLLFSVDHRLLITEKDICTDEVTSILYYACAMDYVNVANHFLSLGTPVNRKIMHHSIFGTDHEWLTPLEIAFDHEADNVAALLLENGADVHSRDKYWRTPLHSCSGAYNCQKLLSLGADLHALDLSQQTPAHTIFGSTIDIELIDAFLERDMDINSEDGIGETPFTMMELYFDLDVHQPALPVVKYIKKLEILGFYISGRNLSKYEDFMGFSRFIGYDEAEFTSKCHKELQKLKETKVDVYTNLYNIIYKDSHKMTRHIMNETLIKFVHSEDLKKNFPIYGYLVKLQFERGLARKSKEEESIPVLETLVGHHSSSFCFDYLLQYLSDDDLKVLFEVL